MSAVELSKSVDQHFTRIHRAALMLTGNPWDADDLAQETFLVLARQGDRFEGRSSLYTWLYGILLNLDRRHRRRSGLRRRKLQVLRDRRHSDPTRWAPAAETSIEVAEWKRSLWAVVARLPDRQRQSLVLRYSEHLSYKAIAAVMGCPIGTVKSRIFNGLVNLRNLLDVESHDAADVPQHTWEDLTRAV